MLGKRGTIGVAGADTVLCGDGGTGTSEGEVACPEAPPSLGAAPGEGDSHPGASSSGRSSPISTALPSNTKDEETSSRHSPPILAPMR